MNPVSRQDVQNIIDISRNRIMERMVTRQDFLTLCDTVKNLVSLHQQSQQLLKQGDYQRSQLSRRLVALEARTISLESEVRALSVHTSRLVDQRSPLVAAAAQNQLNERVPQQSVQHAEYRPA
jgi:hypothetical protein